MGSGLPLWTELKLCVPEITRPHRYKENRAFLYDYMWFHLSWSSFVLNMRTCAVEHQVFNMNLHWYIRLLGSVRVNSKGS